MTAPHSAQKHAGSVQACNPIHPRFASAQAAAESDDARSGFSATYSLRIRVSDRKRVAVTAMPVAA